MKIAFVYAGGREARWNAALAGQTPTDFFYGAVELARAGHEVTCLDAPDPRRSLAAMAYNRLFDARTPVRTRGEHVVATGRVLRRLRPADVVVAASTSHANALSLWRRWGRLSPRIVGIHCGHVNFEMSPQRRRSTQSAMRDQEVVLFADAERDETIRQCGVDEARVHVNPFGVDVDFWTPGDESGDFVLAVGNDGRRDYRTLVAAVTNLPAPVKIVTNRPLPELPSHVEHLRGSWHAPAVTDGELRELYRRAAVVVVPLEDSIQPSGQSVALQAMACGRPVILTRTRGLWTGNDFREDRDLVFVAPGAASELAEKLRGLLDEPARRAEIGRSARAAVVQNGTMLAFATRLGKVAESART